MHILSNYPFLPIKKPKLLKCYWYLSVTRHLRYRVLVVTLVLANSNCCFQMEIAETWEAEKSVTIRIDRVDFRCTTNWTIQEAEVKIRSGFNFRGGYITNKGFAVRSFERLKEDGIYEFVHGQQLPEPQPTPLQSN